MTRDEAKAILALPQDKAVRVILALAEKAEKYDEIVGAVSPTTPSGMMPPYIKPPHKGRKKRPGRKKGHPGVSRASDRKKWIISKSMPWSVVQSVTVPLNALSRPTSAIRKTFLLSKNQR